MWTTAKNRAGGKINNFPDLSKKTDACSWAAFSWKRLFQFLLSINYGPLAPCHGTNSREQRPGPCRYTRLEGLREPGFQKLAQFGGRLELGNRLKFLER